jgi:hypothetical protein
MEVRASGGEKKDGGGPASDQLGEQLFFEIGSV